FINGIGQTAKNSRKALTFELPSITNMVRPRGSALAFLVPQNRFRFFEKNRGWARRDLAPRSQRRSRWSDGRRTRGWSRLTSRLRITGTPVGQSAQLHTAVLPVRGP